MLIAILILLLLAVIIFVVIPVIRKQREKKHQERLAEIARLVPLVESALGDVCSYYSYNHYITESERLTLDEKFAELQWWYDWIPVTNQ